MDLFTTLRFYVEKMLNDTPGMKALLLDADTTQIVSTVYSQSEILEHEVFLVEKLKVSSAERLHHLKAICFLRPTRENVALLRRELREPRFKDYTLIFTNRVEDLRLQDLAEVDSKELVSQVQEFFGDFEVLDQYHFLTPLARPYVALQPVNWEYGHSSDAIARMTEGLAALMLSLRRRFQIRYQRGSEMCEKLAHSLHQLTTGEERELFDFGSRVSEQAPVVLILDRKEDPVTPLLTQWTYQAMVHELLGIQANRVVLPQAANVKKDFQDIVLSARQDEFYKQHMFKNFGDIGAAVKDLVDEFQKHSANSRAISTLEDMQNFVDNYGDYSAAQRNASKHVTLLSALSAIVDSRNLMQVSSAEQEVSCSSHSPQGHFEALQELISSPRTAPEDRLRLVLLYALRYEQEGRAQAGQLVSILQNSGLPDHQLSLLKSLLRVAGAERRVGDLFSDRSFSSRFATMAKQSLRGVENVYTQHNPLLINTLELLTRGRLKDVDYPWVSKPVQAGPVKAPKLIIVYIIGGTTYEESKAIAELNLQGERGEGWTAGIRFLLGGSCVQNSQSFLSMLSEVQRSEKSQ